jgi:hypothetical protein
MAEYVSGLEDWPQTANRLEEKWSPGRDPDDIPYPNQPTIVNVVFRFDAPGLVAKNDDKFVIRWMLVYVTELEKLVKPHGRTSQLMEPSRRVRGWRDGTQPRHALIAFLKLKINEVGRGA